MRIFLLFVFLIGPLLINAQEKNKIILDADTGNEVDDLFAITRGLMEPDWDILGLNATQYQASHWAEENSMEVSYRLNDVLLSYLNKNETIVSNRGARARLFDWGNRTQTSAASSFIIQEAQKIKEGKLVLVTLGALTNVASAILDAPDITEKLKVYWLGTTYDFEENVMKNIDFNCVMDIQALDVVLNSNIELHIIPINVAAKLTFDWELTNEKFKGKHDLLDFLLLRWYNHLDGGRRQRTLWDLALIQAIIFPEYAQEVKINTSKEKGNREIWYIKNIDQDKMREEFYSTTLKYLKDND